MFKTRQFGSERRLDAMRWVHDIPGGRGWDVGVVKYTSDPSVIRERIKHALRPRPEYVFGFEELLLRRWAGPEAGERLSVDWDCFASILQDRSTMTDRVDTFVARLGDYIPADSYVCYSPDYSHFGSLPAFLELVELLARRYGQDIEWLAPGLKEGKLNPEGIDTGLPRQPLARTVAISILSDQHNCYNESFRGLSFTKFDGTSITI